MRHEPTPTEELLWQRLRGRQLQGLKFRRQHPLERFVLDFYCPDVRLAVEVDGPVHQYSREEDALRAEFLASQGICVLRFGNEAVLDYTDKVIQTIADAATAQVSGLIPMTLHDPGDPLDGAADIALVEVRCESCGGAWEEFRATAEALYRPADDATLPRKDYVSSKKDCVFCNETPGDYIRGGKWRRPE